MKLKKDKIQIFLSFLVPLLLSLTFRLSSQLSVSLIGLLDIVNFALFYGWLQLFFLKHSSNRLRIIGGALLLIIFQIFYLGTLNHYRFFYSWIYWDAVYQWVNLGELGGAFGELTEAMDLLIFILPLTVFFLISKKPIKISYRPQTQVLLVLILTLSIHLFISNDKILYKENEPFFYVFRQKINQLYRHLKISKTADVLSETIRNRTPIVSSIYEYSEFDSFPLQKNPLQESSKSQSKPNVVFIILESVRAFESGAYGANPSYTPNFDTLAKSGLLLKNYYSNATQTIRSEFALLSSYLPNLYGSPTYLQFPNVSVKTLPMILKKHGYKTHWISGFSPLFGNKKKFLSTHGIDSFHFEIQNPDKVLGWGPSDEDIFIYASHVLDNQEQPFFAEIMTLSNHYPFNHNYPTENRTPKSKFGTEALYENYLDGVYYLDYAMGKFFKANKNKAWFNNTLFVITSDNGIWLFPDKNEFENFHKQEIYYRIPGLIWGPQIIEKGIFKYVSSQVDIAPTILDLLKIYSPNSFIGTSLFKNIDSDNQAYMLREERWNYRKGNTYIYDIGPEVFKEHFPKPSRPIARSEIRHRGFQTEKDILLGVDRKSISDISQEKLKFNQQEIEENLDVYQFLLANNKIYKREKQQAVHSADRDKKKFNDHEKFVAHAGGASQGLPYTNSLNALNENYKIGFRHFEVDLKITADNFLVLTHDWEFIFEEKFDEVPNLKQFKTSKTKNNVEVLSFNELETWLKQHPDAKIITDIKNDRYLDILKLVTKNYPAVVPQLIPQIYKPSDYSFLRAVGFEKILFTGYRSKLSLTQILNAPELSELYGIVLPFQFILDSSFVRKLKNKGIFVYAHTVNNPEVQKKLTKKGVDGFFVDFLPDSELNSNLNY